MKNLKVASSVEILTSFNLGQGKTVDIPTFASVNGDTITYNGIAATVTPEWKDAFILMSVNNLVKDKPQTYQEKLFKAYNDCRLSLNHTIDNGDTKVKTPLKNHVLTSDEYTTAVFVKAATGENIETIYDIVQGVIALGDKATKQSLQDALVAIGSLIMSDDQLATLTSLQAKEANFVKIKETFKDRATITFVDENTFSVKVPVTLMPEVVTEFTTLGYVQGDKVDFDVKTMSVTLTMDNKKV